MAIATMKATVVRHDEYICMRIGGSKSYRAILTNAKGFKKLSRKKFTRAMDAVEYKRRIDCWGLRTVTI